MRIVVLDLDETIGSFQQLSFIWQCIVIFFQNSNVVYDTYHVFNEFMDAFPEVLRPNIIKVFKYLKKKSTTDACSAVVLYTNNQGQQEWLQYLVEYFHFKLQYRLFTNVISAYKINGVRVCKCRTQSSKCWADLARCLELSKADQKHADVIFIDDSLVPGLMGIPNVCVVKVTPYCYTYTNSTILLRLHQSLLKGRLVDSIELVDFVKEAMYKYTANNATNKDIILYEDDSAVWDESLNSFFGLLIGPSSLAHNKKSIRNTRRHPKQQPQSGANLRLTVKRQKYLLNKKGSYA